MKTSTQIEAVPTPAEVLRQAIAERDKTQASITTNLERFNFLKPIEDACAAAEAELAAVAQADAEAMNSWVRDGARTAPPEPDHAAREGATRKLNDARAKLAAAGAVRGQVEKEHGKAAAQFSVAQQTVHAAELDVIGHELVRSAKAMRAAAETYLKAERHLFIVRRQLMAFGGHGVDIFTAIADPICAPIRQQEENELAQEWELATFARLAALRNGNEPSELPA